MPIDIQRVLICDAVDEACVRLLQNNGIKVDYKLKLSKEQLCAEVKNYDALVIRTDTKITAEVLEASAGRIKIVGRAGVGVDNIDIDAATKRNVVVLNAPNGNSISVVELTCGLIFSVQRLITLHDSSLKHGQWSRYVGSEVYNKTLAIIGLGRIGLRVANAMTVFGMKVIGYDPYTTAEQARAAGIEKMDLDDIWPRADIISIHVPLTPATKNLINADVLGKCKRGVKLMNVARGGIINEADLLVALDSGQCGGAGIDVFEQEPPTTEVTKTLSQHPAVVASPHIGATMNEALARVAVEVAEQFIALTGHSKEYTKYHGVINRQVLLKYTE